jgi:hypothetical protein
MHISRFIQNLRRHIKEDPKSFRLYSILRILVLLTLIRSIFNGNIESAFLCILSLLLFLLPALFETQMDIRIPTLFENIIYLFIYAAEILGEINHYYVLIPGWDTMLHTLNGFLCAAVGFSLVDLLNRKSTRLELSPVYVAIVAFCFSMTVGVLWEFFEFSMDQLFHLDMQKDFIIRGFGSVSIDSGKVGMPADIRNITETIINTADGKSFVINGGYLDVGIIDTMKDLFVNFIGAVVFSILGFFYIRNRDKNAGRKIVEGLYIRRNEGGEPSDGSFEKEGSSNRNRQDGNS